MIIRENTNSYDLITQHDHGILSGEIAYHWGNEHFPKATFEQILAATYHDFGWFEKDSQPIWDNENNRPYDFINYPTSKKLGIYTDGINHLEKLHPYCALLTSLHYCSFFHQRKDSDVQHFIVTEKRRQSRLMKTVPLERIQDELSFLKLCDDLSLYVSLNEPGINKQSEHPWYKNGVTYRNNKEEIVFHLKWENETDISISPFPFKQEWSTTIRYKTLVKGTRKVSQEYVNKISFIQGDINEYEDGSKLKMTNQKPKNENEA
jgi:hypothetical protein